MRIDNWIRWPWWTVMIPAFIVDAFLLFIYVSSIPIFIKKSRENKSLDYDERLPLLPNILDSLNGILFIIAQVCLILRLDHIWNVYLTVSLIPYFVYALQNLYMPFVLWHYRLVPEDGSTYSISTLVVAITVFLVAAKHDGIINWSWELTFIFVWVYYGIRILASICVVRSLKRQAVWMAVLLDDQTPEALLKASAFRWMFFSSIGSIVVAVLILYKISGVWRWALSALVIPILVIVIFS